jgi:hypothetical protein
MATHTMIYGSADEKTDGALADPAPDEETVIVEGAAMTLRAYRRRGG